MLSESVVGTLIAVLVAMGVQSWAASADIPTGAWRAAPSSSTKSQDELLAYLRELG